ncbi:hypothetical protein HF086_004989 [Spodoptera exigua]|uniref:Uncharacterized protein n=1 Tax=Spodoptera exigua TaxID=7107 RepID=A0A922M1W5_SPOEX|nr:hypothetical protein HF086_004989 [Spodoptera exigua]
MITNTHESKRKEISWNASTYLDKVHLKDLNTRSTGELERQASIGPCYKKTLPFGEPSGISIFLPKKNLDYSKSKEFEIPKDYIEVSRKKENIEFKVADCHCETLFGNLKGKLETFRGKIKHALHM